MEPMPASVPVETPVLPPNTVSTAYRTTRKFFMGAIAFQFACLAVLAVPNAYTLATGQEIVLESHPVDPHALFKGDYVTLSYDFTNPGLQLPPSEEAWVVLRKGDKAWQFVKAVQGPRPKLPADHIAVRGRADQYGRGVDCGIEQYYVPERTGLGWERAPRLFVTVAVDNFGHAVVKRISK